MLIGGRGPQGNRARSFDEEEVERASVFDEPEAEPTCIFVDPFACNCSPLDWRQLQAPPPPPPYPGSFPLNTVCYTPTLPCRCMLVVGSR